MTAILVLTTVIILLTIDYLHFKRVAVRKGQAAEPAEAPALRLAPAHVGGFQVREDFGYHPGHTWALRESKDRVRIGIDDLAARLIGKADSIELPKFGQWIRQGQKFCTIQRDGSTATLVSPIEGMVTDVNMPAVENPAVATEDPYGEGWLLAVQAPDADTGYRNLLQGSVARSWMEEAASRLRAAFPALAGATAQDGGVAVKDLAAEMPEESWRKLTAEFFLS